jgi:uncharacterized protein (DUF697 family)
VSDARVEAVASLHLLVWIAKADGTLHPEERAAIQGAIEAVELGDLVDAKELFEDDFDVADQIALLRSREAKDEAFRAAYTLAFADGDCSDAERERLDELRKRLGVATERERELSDVLAPRETTTSSGEPSSAYELVADETERKRIIADLTRVCAIQSAVLGAFPVPILAVLTDLAVVALQLDLVRDIAALHGKRIERTMTRSMLAGAGMTGARIAVSNVAKLVPGWGSLIAAAAAFASTYAVGRVFEKHFAADGGLTPEELRAQLREARAEGKRAFEENRAEFEKRREETKASVEKLAADAAEGKLSADELAQRTKLRG